MTEIKVSDFVADFIASTGVKHTFTVSGAGNLHLLDSIQNKGEVEIICNHHEQASAMAMESYARCSNNFGVSVVTFGPGCTNAITGVAGAWMDSIPCLTVSGQCKIGDTIGQTGLRQRGIQEINIVDMVKPITKYAVLITKAEDIRYELEKAYHLAKSGRPGPVWVDIPMDIQGQKINPESLRSFTSDTETQTASKDLKSSFDELITKLKSAKRPLILLGNGVRLSGAADKVHDFINTLQAPILSSWNGADLLHSGNKYYVGRPGTYGQRGANFALQNCDFILSIGARMSIPQTGYVMSEFAREAFKGTVDIDEAELNKHMDTFNYACRSDASAFIDKLIEANFKFEDTENWLQYCKTAQEELPSCDPKYYEETQGVNSYVFVDKLNQNLKGNETIVTDMGTSFTCVHQTLELKEGQRFYTSSGLASMGYALPAAIGAAYARKAPVICLVGDGAFQMNLQELSLIKSLNLPIKIFLLNNNGYLTIRQTQDALFNKKYVASSQEYGVHIPDTQKIAKAFELASYHCDTQIDLDKTLASFLETNEPGICEIIMPEKQLLVPKSSVSMKANGELVSRPLEDLFPFLPRETFKKHMIIDPLPASEEE